MGVSFFLGGHPQKWGGFLLVSFYKPQTREPSEKQPKKTTCNKRKKEQMVFKKNVSEKPQKQVGWVSFFGAGPLSGVRVLKKEKRPRPRVGFPFLGPPDLRGSKKLVPTFWSSRLERLEQGYPLFQFGLF